MKIFVAHPSTIDFRQELYHPIKRSDLSSEHDFFLPQDSDAPVTRDLIKNSDAMIVEVSEASTGSGIEMGWANTLHVPILALHKAGTRPSKAVTYVTNDIHEYENTVDLVNKIEEFLINLKKPSPK